MGTDEGGQRTFQARRPGRRRDDAGGIGCAASYRFSKGTTPRQSTTSLENGFSWDGDEECDITVFGDLVSKRHAQLLLEGDGYAIENLDSNNHTCVNSEPIVSRVTLKDGDQIAIGETVLAFRTTQPTVVEKESTSACVLSKTDARAGAFQLLEVNAEAKLHAILRISEALGRTLDLETLLPKVLAGLFKIFLKADRALILLCEGERLVPKAAQHRQGQSDSIEYSKTIIQEAMASRQAILSEDAASDARFPLARSIQQIQIRSMICVPLLSHTADPLGAIQVRYPGSAAKVQPRRHAGPGRRGQSGRDRHRIPRNGTRNRWHRPGSRGKSTSPTICSTVSFPGRHSNWKGMNSGPITWRPAKWGRLL